MLGDLGRESTYRDDLATNAISRYKTFVLVSDGCEIAASAADLFVTIALPF